LSKENWSKPQMRFCYLTVKTISCQDKKNTQNGNSFFLFVKFSLQHKEVHFSACFLLIMKSGNLIRKKLIQKMNKLLHKNCEIIFPIKPKISQFNLNFLDGFIIIWSRGCFGTRVAIYGTPPQVLGGVQDSSQLSD